MDVLEFSKTEYKKTEIILFGPKDERLKVIAHLESMILKSTYQVRSLDEVLNLHLNFMNHIKVVTNLAYSHLKNIARIKGFLSQQDTEKLVHVFIFSRLDYCNGVFTGLSKKLDSCSLSRMLPPESSLIPRSFLCVKG